ncbi:MAG: ATP-binding protein [Thermomicrobiales bacterium]
MLRAALLRQTVRLVTLTGPGGVGKSRLALAAGAAVAPAFPDGVRLVRLAAITDPGLVLPTIAATLGLRDAGNQAPLAALQAALHDRQMLLILDNFEQIVAAGADLADLLRACPRLKALVTSRARLRVRGEHVIPVLPLAVPDDVAALDEEAVRTYPAVDLFLQRGREIRPDLGQSPGDTAAIVGICRRLDGLPLALELAAARLDILPPPALLERLQHTLPLLTGGARDLPDRLRTMRDAITWSYDLLDDDEQALFRRLAVFAGGFTLEAAEAVASRGVEESRSREGRQFPLSSASRLPPPASSVLDGIASLAEKSLLRLEEGADGEPRYLMLETVRELGREQLAVSGDEAAARRRHAAWCQELAERAEPELLGPEQRRWCERLEAEHANLRAVHAWLIETGNAAPALRLASALWVFWFLRGHLREGYAWLAQALAIESDAPPAGRVEALWGAGMLAWASGNYRRAEALGVQARELAEAHGLVFGKAAALYLLFLAIEMQDRLDEAIALGEESVARMRESGVRAWLAYVLADVGTRLLATVDRERGEAWIEEGLALHRELGNKQGIGNKLNDLGLVSHEAGDARAAARHYADSLRWLLEGGDAWYLASPIEGLAAIALDAGQVNEATRLLGAAAALREWSGGAVWTTERDRLERTIAAARASLGHEIYAEEMAVGRSMPLPEVVAVATAIAETSPAALSAVREPTPSAAAGLSPRELDVLRLLVIGKSNPEIADALFIGRGTVRTHVSNILAKLGAKTRTEASMLARDRGLV